MERFGKYALEKRIAAGGMAEIFFARLDGAAGFEKPVVLKRILPENAADQDFIAMFTDEARLAAKLQHPNIVQVFEFGETDGSFFMAMEYIDGVDLGVLLRKMHARGHRMSIECAVTMVTSALKALQYAHDKRDNGLPLAIVHRDVSPSNILVSREGFIKLTDFGIAKASLRAFQTKTGVLKGKLAYMSPEQAKREAVDKRADIYATGLVAFELFAGRRAYDAEYEEDVFKLAVEAKVPSITALVPDFPIDVAAVVAKALAPKPTDRFAECADFANALVAAFSKHGQPADERTIAKLVQAEAPKEERKTKVLGASPEKTPNERPRRENAMQAAALVASEILATKNRAFAMRSIGNIGFSVSPNREFRDDEWKEFNELLRRFIQSNGSPKYLLNYSLTHAPSAKQRKESDSEGNGELMPFAAIAIVSDSVLARGAMIAFQWLFKTKIPMKAYSGAQSEAAVRWLCGLAGQDFEPTMTAFRELVVYAGHPPLK